MMLTMERFKSELKKKKPPFTSLAKPTHWGEGSEHLSEQIDEILYGE
ncbi:hypothetical protein HYU22_01995 [Candidatus Woesearchaeota archaeon]|nr:hypothetical protein [Candidatus Woesearchaeota archaeon]